VPLQHILQEEVIGVDLAPLSGASSNSSHRKRRLDTLACTSAEDSPASASSPPTASTEAASPPFSPSPQAQAPTDPLVAELLTLIDWPNASQRPKARRTRGSSAMTQAKHVANEAARRSQLSDAIEVPFL
jgi:hypothetical protein